MKIGFVCDKNSNRSIIAEAITLNILKELGLKADVYSASLKPDNIINDITISLLRDKGFNVNNLKNNTLEDIPYEELDILIVICDKMDDTCPYIISHKRRETWLVEEPDHISKDRLNFVFEKLEKLIKELFKYERK